MASTHSNRDAEQKAVAEWLESLGRKADKMKAEGSSSISAGAPGEPTLAHWAAHGIDVEQLPDDEHGILRISVGGGDTPANVNYCRFRGDREECVALLRRALRAMERGRSS